MIKTLNKVEIEELIEIKKKFDDLERNGSFSNINDGEKIIESLKKVIIDEKIKNTLLEFLEIDVEKNIQLKSLRDNYFIVKNNFKKFLEKENYFYPEIEREANTFKNVLDKIVNYEELDFFQKNIIIVGANGSGKTFFALDLSVKLGGDGIFISSQKHLNLSAITAIPLDVENKYKGLQQSRDISKNPSSEHEYVKKHFNLAISSLIILHSDTANKYLRDSQIQVEKIEPPISILDKTLSLWNKLIKTRILIHDNNKIVVKKGEYTYDIFALSEGEKVILYYISQVLLAPKNGFIIVDEPETYLHKNIVSKLWNTLQEERNDCKFVYVTHDIDFVETRSNFLKLWIKEYTPFEEEHWKFKKIIYNKIPENLYLEILGSKQPILFCEGNDEDSLDKKILEALFGDKFLIKPLESCQKVIDYTKVYNKLDIKNQKAYGIIDRDFRSIDELNSLEKCQVFTYEIAEVENLLCYEIILIKILEKAKEFLNIKNTEAIIENIKNRIFEKFKKDCEEQSIKFLKEELQYKLGKEKIHQPKTKEDFEKKLNEYLRISQEFKDNIEIKLNGMKDDYTKIIDDKDYNECLKKYNNKGCYNGIVKSEIRLPDIENPALELLKNDSEVREVILEKISKELINIYQNLD